MTRSWRSAGRIMTGPGVNQIVCDTVPLAEAFRGRLATILLFFVVHLKPSPGAPKQTIGRDLAILEPERYQRMWCDCVYSFGRSTGFVGW